MALIVMRLSEPAELIADSDIGRDSSRLKPGPYTDHRSEPARPDRWSGLVIGLSGGGHAARHADRGRSRFPPTLAA